MCSNATRAAVAWGDVPPLRHHRRRSRRHPGRHVRGPSRRRGDADRTGHRRRRGEPVGLRAVQGDDRHRRVRSSRSTTPPGMGLGVADPDGRPGRAASRASARSPAASSATCASCSRARASSLVRGTGRLVDDHTVVADTAEGERTFAADAIMVATGSRPRIPDWAQPDGERVLTTRDAYPPPAMPEHLVVIGSGVTGVEFVHMFASFGSAGDPDRVPPAGAAGQGPRGRRGARGGLPASRRAALQGGAGGRPGPHRRRASSSAATTAGRPRAATRCWRSARSPTSRASGLDAAGVEMDGPWVRDLDHHLRTNVRAHLRRR